MRTILTFLALMMLINFNIDAQISFTDLIPDVRLTGKVNPNTGDSLAIDFNNDNQHEYELMMFNGGSWLFAYIQSGQNNPPNNSIAASNTTTPRQVLALKANDTVFTNQPWELVNGGNLEMVNIGFVPSGQWQSLSDGYIGCKFLIGTNTHYGWIRAGISAGNDTLIVKSYAYNTQPNQCIITGNTTTTSCSIVTGIESTTNEGFELYPNPSSGLINIYTYFLDSEITIFNASGQTVLNTKIKKGANSVDLSNNSSGIYFYTLKNEVNSEIISGKIILNGN